MTRYTYLLDYIIIGLHHLIVCLVVCIYLPIIQTICLWDINAATKVNESDVTPPQGTLASFLGLSWE